MTPQTALPGILLVTFGVTARYGGPALLAFTERVRAAFPGHVTRWAFTACHKHWLFTPDDQPGHDVAAALSAFADEGLTSVAVQPLHLIAGHEYETLCRTVTAWREMTPGISVRIGNPLLADESAEKMSLEAMRDIALSLPGDEVAVWVGHGSGSLGPCGYSRMAQRAVALETPVLVGCLDSKPDIDDVVAALGKTGRSGVCLMPFFAFSGFHATRDVGGKGEDSWQSRLRRAGFAARMEPKGLVEHEAFAAMWLARLHEALGLLPPKKKTPTAKTVDAVATS